MTQISRGISVARTNKSRVSALAYLRTSSAANLGAHKDSDRRQRAAIEAFATHNGYAVVEEFYDAAVSGADPIEGRPGFKALLERITGNGVRTVIVEDATRFARALMVQEAGIAVLVSLGVRVLTSRGDDLTESDDEMRIAMRQIAGVFSQLEKTRLVKKLKGARDRRRKATGHCEGRLTRAARLRERLIGGDLSDDVLISIPVDLHNQLPVDRQSGLTREAANRIADKVAARLDEAAALAKRLRRASPMTGERMSLRKISDKLAEAGYLNELGRPYKASGIQAFINAR